MRLFLGTAGWSIRTDQADRFPGEGMHLVRYARQFNAVEINSSFYRPHRASTYARWAASTPPEFRFAVKLPKQITHELRLADADSQVDKLLEEVAGLGDKLGAILVQLPPSLAFDLDVARPFLSRLSEKSSAGIVCEPRHASWFTREAAELLSEHHVARVAADPAIVPEAARPGGCSGLAYFRWHGSPRMYYSSYDEVAIKHLAGSIQEASRHASDVWCIFDNTAEGAATFNAQQLLAHLQLEVVTP